jgi:hypothetical protein
MKRPTILLEAMLTQVGIDLDLATERDASEILKRLEHEGLSFLTITLPLLSDALESGLESGFFICPTNFGRHKRLPKLLSGFFKNVFLLDGSLRPDACPYSIAAIRQVCRFFKKPKLECSGDRKIAAIAKFKAVEGELRLLSSSLENEDHLLDDISRRLWTEVFPYLDQSELVGRHGPGVTADRKKLNERHSIKYWYERFEHEFPLDLMAFHSLWEASGSGYSKGCSGIKMVPVSEEIPVRVTFVPKTLNSPRVIAIEPSSMMFVQQSLMNYIVPRLESHRLTKSSIRFSDQRPNQLLAWASSKDRKLATLDLSDASDRVHRTLVRRIFKGSGIADYLDSARSLSADLPDGVNLVLEKYASMGSALCFPVEAMVFYTLIQVAIHRYLGIRPSTRTLMRFSSQISVYGDDLIFPVDYVDAVTSELELRGLRVNMRKSFRTAHFRESCGGDFFKGVSVTPIYARMDTPTASRDWTPSHVMSWVSVANQFYMAGSWHMAQVIRDMVESVLRTRLPRRTERTAGMSFSSLMFNTRARWNSALQCWEQRMIHYVPLKQKDIIDGNAQACMSRSLRPNSVYPDSPRSSWESRDTSGCRNGGWGLQNDESLSEPPIKVWPKVRFTSNRSYQPASHVTSALHAEVAFHRVLEIAGPTDNPGLLPGRCNRVLRSLQRDGLRPMRGDELRSQGTDFLQSVKSGAFKSKHRGVPLS